jgi:hypothetical protein
LLALALLFSQELLAQCPMCQTGLTQSAEGQRWARGINAGILLLLAAPFVIIGSCALVIYRPQVIGAAARIRARLERRVRMLLIPRASPGETGQ